MSTYSEKENRLEACIRQGDTEGALRFLFELAVAHAREKNFQKAENYRDRIYEIDPMALSEIIRVNEIIDEEKAQGIDLDHKELFSHLYDQLTAEEGNALFYTLEEMTVPADTVVFKQGDSCDGLFFVNSGQLRVGCKQGSRELLIQVIEPGDFFGEGTFFSNTVATTTVATLSNSKIYKLSRKMLGRLNADVPGLVPKLNSYCLNEETISKILEKRGMDRRNRNRHKLSGRALIQVLGDSDKLIGKPLRVALLDISSGGTSFLLRISKEEKASLMLGRRLVIQYGSEKSSQPDKIQKKGAIVAVSPSPFEDYSFHVKFDTDLRSNRMDTILSAYSEIDDLEC